MTTSSGEYRLIALTQGQFAIVDAADFDWLSQWDWQACKKRCGFYARRTMQIKGRKMFIYMHNQIMDFTPTRNRLIDHEDRNTLNNRRFNLRFATRQENQHNASIRTDSNSGFKGVGKHHASAKWQARIAFNGTRIYLGLFDTPEAAHAAYCEAATKYHGEFARVL